MTPVETDDALLARLLAQERQGGAARTSIPRRPAGGDAPLSFGQRRLWFLDRLVPGTAAYTISAAFRLSGPFDLGFFERSVRAVEARHEILRTVFLAGPEGEPFQRVREPGGVNVDFGFVDAAGEPDPAATVRALAAREAAHVFDLERGPLARVRVIRTGAGEHAVVCTLHHIVSDGWSTGVLIREIGAHYAALAAGRPAGLPPLAVQYGDYAAWQRSPEIVAATDASVGWWRERLAGLPALDAPTDFARPAVQGFRGASLPIDTGPGVRAALADLAKREGTTVFAVSLAAFQVALAAWSGQRDFGVGAPVAGRTKRELEPLIGFFVNTLVFRADLAGDPTFAELVRRMGAAVRDALGRQDAPFDRLVEELNPERQLGYTPLVQAVLAFEQTPAKGLALPGLSLDPIEPEAAVAKFDLTLGLSDSPAGLRGGLDYAADLFAPETAAQLVRLLQRVMAGAAASPGARVSALVEPDAAERKALETLGRGPELRNEDQETAAATRLSVPEQVADQARRAPEAPAIKEGGRVMTYGELAARARGLAKLLAERGAGPETIVAVCLPRSAGLAVAQLAAWFAGAAFLPLDPSHPAPRLRALAAEAHAVAIVADPERRPIFEAAGTPVLDWSEGHPGPEGGAPAPKPDPAALAYVIFTSGSTGRPKGVAVGHGALSNLAAWHLEAFGLKDSDTATLLASPAFDASVWELWPALAAGARVTVPPPELLADPPALRDWFVAEEATIGFVPTPLAELLLGLPWPGTARLRWMLTGGDRLRTAPPEGLPFRLSNNYGPTEHAVVATSGPVAGGPSVRPPDLGRPIARTRLQLLDERGRLTPAGAVGEIGLSGPSLARGYLGRPDLTAEAFVPDPFSAEPGTRMYRTGDLARWRTDGTLEFRGRADQQVKVRGVRIELGEVEAALLALPGVRSAVAGLRRRGGEPALTAWLVSAPDSTPDEEAARAALRERLLPAMVPTIWVWLPELPMTPNGKVDRAALRVSEAVQTAAVEPPATAMEEAVAAVWREVLGVAEVSVIRSFFDAGGHSLLLIRVQDRLQARLGRPITVVDLFAHPTIRALAAHLSSGAESRGEGLSSAAQRGAAQREAQRRRRERAGREAP